MNPHTNRGMRASPPSGHVASLLSTLRVFEAMSPQIPRFTKNDLDRGRRYGRDVSDGGIPHGFHTNDRVKLHHPAQPRKTRDGSAELAERAK